MKRNHVCIRPFMIPVEPALEHIVSGHEECPLCSTPSREPDEKPASAFKRLRWPRLRRVKGLATGIIGLW